MKTTCTQRDWTAPDGESFSYSHWSAQLEPGEKLRGAVVAVHGLSGAAFDYEPLGAHLRAHGVAVYAPELRGQGNDPVAKRRGDLDRIETWFADLAAFVHLVRQEVGDAPLYFYGESMGAAILTRFLAQAPAETHPAGLVLASPVIAIAEEPAWWQHLIFRFFLFVNPTHRVDVRRFTKKGDPAKLVTRDEAHRLWFETAPHKMTTFTLRFFRNLYDLIAGCAEAAPRLRGPVLVLYAANDVFIPPARVEEFYARLGSSQKQLRFFPESYHLLLHDDDRAEVLAMIEDWLLPQLGAGAKKIRSA